MLATHVDSAPPSSMEMARSDLPGRTVEISWTFGTLGSGILLTPYWVLSAAHLYLTPRKGYCEEVCITQRGGACVSGTWWQAWEDLDLAILRLETPIEGPEVPLEPRELSDGATGVIVGYGDTSGVPEIRGVKIVSFDTAQITIEIVDPSGTQSICYGDSGGPFFVDRAGRLQLVGIISHFPKYRLRWFLHGIARRVHFFRGYGERVVVCSRVDLEKTRIEGGMSQPEPMPCELSPYRRFRVMLASFLGKLGYDRGFP